MWLRGRATTIICSSGGSWPDARPLASAFCRRVAALDDFRNWVGLGLEAREKK